MAVVIESFDSRQIKGCPPREALFKYSVLNCQDEEEAEGLIFGEAPQQYRDLIIDGAAITITKGGHNWFTVEVPYVAPPVPEFPGGGDSGEWDPSVSVLEFDTGGGTQHVTQCISQSDYGPEAAADIRLARVVGLTRDGVDGVDQVVPKLELAITKTYPIGQITSLFIKNLARATGKVNAAPYAISLQTYDAGELLFLGAAGKEVQKDDEWKWEITYKWSASENRQNILIKDHADEAQKIIVAAKKGHEYLWVLYKKDEADNRFVEVPDVAFVAKLYEETDFNSLIGPLF